MLYYKRIYIFILFVTQCLILSGINIPTYPFIDNYTKHDYFAGTQNWDIVQDNQNKMYFANNLGVLQYDGYKWQLCKVSNQSIVRSLCLLGNDSLAVGAYNEFGLIHTNELGQLEFESWVNKLPEQYRNFSEVWRIHKFDNRLIVQSFNYLFIFENGTLKTIIEPQTNYKYSFIVNNKLYIQELNKGLFEIDADTLVPVKNGNFYNGKEIWTILPFDKNRLLIGTQLNGFYIFDGENHKQWDSEANNFILKNNLFSAIQTKNGNYCFGSIQNGLITTNSKGEILVFQNTDLGLQNNTVLSMYEDTLSNLWIGLDNGIDYSKTNSSIKQVSNKDGFGTGYASIVHKQILYVGTNQGLFYTHLDNKNKPYKINEFHLLEKAIGQVWSLKVIDNTLFCCHNSGLFIIQDTNIKQIESRTGIWKINKIPGNNNELLIGSYQGLWVYNRLSKQVKKLSGFNESARNIVFDDNNKVLVSHGYKGIYRLKIDLVNYEVSILDLYNGSKYLPNYYGNEIFNIRGQLIACTNNGMYEYKDNAFKYLDYWDHIIPEGANQISSLIESENSKIWCFKQGKVYQINYLNSDMYEVQSEAFLPLVNTFPKNFENVYSFETNKYLLGNENGFILYNDNSQKNSDKQISLNLSQTVSFDEDERIWKTLPFKHKLTTTEIGKLKYDQRRLRLIFSIPYFMQQNLVHIRYRNNNGPWTTWTKANIIEFNNLREGKYYTDVQCSVDKKQIEDEHTIIFEIAPPFYRTWQMYLIYLAGFFSITLLVARIIKKRIDKARRLEKIKIEKRNNKKQLQLTQKAELAESELIKFRNESLRSDIRHKSKELANNTMSIINKNKVLQHIKEVLTTLRKEDINYHENTKIDKLIKKINKEIESQDNWMVFEQNFDNVHENFLKRIKEKHDELSPKDLRLAAYLRMNLSSKEIAPLLNISIRSVEISRYRLRKKMNLEHNQNLTEYLIQT